MAIYLMVKVQIPARAHLTNRLQRALNPNLLRLFGSGSIIILEVSCTANHCWHVNNPPLPLSQRVARGHVQKSHTEKVG